MSTQRRAATPTRHLDPNLTARGQRDAALERGRTIFKSVALGSVAAVAAAGIYLSQALPGHAASPGNPSGSVGNAGAATPAGGGTSEGSASAGAGLSAPASTPVPAYQPAPVVSGSS